MIESSYSLSHSNAVVILNSIMGINKVGKRDTFGISLYDVDSGKFITDVRGYFYFDKMFVECDDVLDFLKIYNKQTGQTIINIKPGDIYSGIFKAKIKVENHLNDIYSVTIHKLKLRSELNIDFEQYKNPKYEMQVEMLTSENGSYFDAFC